MNLYVAVDIGCIECGEESAVLGVFTDREAAEAVRSSQEKIQAEHWMGQHSFEIFEIEEMNKPYPAHKEKAP